MPFRLLASLLHVAIPFGVLAAVLGAGCTSRDAAPGAAPTGRQTPVAGFADADWTTSAQAFRGQIGQRVEFVCPPNPGRADVGPVWGAEVYTDDSSVCAAAVHAGQLSFDEGGAVLVEIRPGQASYRGTDQDGVASRPYGAWDGSFVVH